MLPKGVVLTIEQARNFDLSSYFEQVDSTYSNRVSRMTSTRIKINFPIVNRDAFKMVGGLKYFQDEYTFDQPEKLTNYYHLGLEDKHIKTIGLSLYALKTKVGTNYWAARGSFKLNGDFNKGKFQEHLKTGLTILYGTKNTRFKTWGLGVSYSYTFGVSSVYPVWFHKQRFTNKLAIDFILPVYAKFYYLPTNRKNVFYLENRLEGDNYNLNFDTYPNRPLYLEKANFMSRLTYERQIYDFLWCSVSTGYQFNVNYNLSSSDVFFNRIKSLNSKTDVLVTSTIKPMPVIRLSLFLVPPKKWMEER